MSGNEESKKFGAEGGKARAAKMTKAERIAAAKKAALARWGGELPVATYTGVLNIGDLHLPCAVLSDEKTRLLTQTDFMKGMGMYYSGWVAKNRSVEARAADIPHFLSSKSLKPFIDKHLGDLQSITVRYVTEGGQLAMGIRAEIIPKICEIWMDADEAGALTGARQKAIAEKARKLMRALAYKMIEVLVDDATGFREDRDQRDIARHIRAYVAKDLQKWVGLFPRSFFEQLCRLRGRTLPQDMKLPRYFGHFVNDLVWDRLAPGIKNELRKRNPTTDGRRKHKHYQFLTGDVGAPRLLHHLGVVEGYADRFEPGQWDAFMGLVNAKLPSYSKTPLLAGESDEPRPPRRKRVAKPRAVAQLPAAIPDPSVLSLPLSDAIVPPEP